LTHGSVFPKFIYLVMVKEPHLCCEGSMNEADCNVSGKKTFQSSLFSGEEEEGKKGKNRKGKERKEKGTPGCLLTYLDQKSGHL